MAATVTNKDGGRSAGSKPGEGRVNRFHQRLGQLTYFQACQLLGDEGGQLIRRGGQRFELLSDEDVFLGGDLFRVRVRDAELPGGVAVATFTLQSGRSKQLQTNCDHCETPCEHLGAALAYLLDGKSVLGLAEPPDETVPLENLTEDELLQRAMAERRQRAAAERMTVRSTDTEHPWTDYLVTSGSSGKTYRVALRGTEAGESYCSCPDFRTNHLGTCKHILHTAEKVQKRFSAAQLRAPYRRKNLSLRVYYVGEVGLRFNLPDNPDPIVAETAGRYAEQTLSDAIEGMRCIQSLERAGHGVHVYPDAEEWIQQRLVQDRLRRECEQIRRDAVNHPLRRQLLDAELLPYQLDGIAFAVGAGRAVLADDMGLGKTIQGIGVAELLARQADIQRVLVICPASLKSQWRSEIGRFSGRSVQLVIGNAEERSEQYASDTFFTICNYEQVLRDLSAVEAVRWDLIVLDEGQRIKNWESKTSRVIRSLHSPFSLVLSGTPLENRLDELFTVVRFVDDTRLGPAHRFFHRHRVVDDKGKVLGYQRLDELRETLRPILLRRTRGEVARELPERSDEIVRIRPTAEQKEMHDGHMMTVAQITAKKYLTEMDLLRLQKALLMARMAADSTFLVDKEVPEYSSKLERLAELLEGLLESPERKIILFSEWRRMLDRIEHRLEGMNAQYVRLDGQVPQKKRPGIVARFQEDPACQLILMTNAGSTGLNLQSANTVINVDLPWNPAVLEQRIARAHRMGQKNPVHIYKLVTEDTIEERLLDTLAAKQGLADAALDVQSDVESVELSSGMEELRRRLEKMLTPERPAPIDESQKRVVEATARDIAERRNRVSAAGGQLVGAALQLVGELLSGEGRPAPDPAAVERLQKSLADCVERDEAGKPQLTIRLADDTALRSLAETLARLLT